ncbi:hypothetical protein O181_051245 [Austropuccinia psidii MF-1]|uniref:Uncharacterized protein n=1 Tax=Austropuccinia psidii MF-1 TaxID=1389203 RepID=A0A9Q3DWS1_9BASI|nr:hypothetical protein [Austropuccinia psidii MF-1]
MDEEEVAPSGLSFNKASRKNLVGDWVDTIDMMLTLESRCGPKGLNKTGLEARRNSVLENYEMERSRQWTMDDGLNGQPTLDMDMDMDMDMDRDRDRTQTNHH